MTNPNITGCIYITIRQFTRRGDNIIEFTATDGVRTLVGDSAWGWGGHPAYTFQEFLELKRDYIARWFGKSIYEICGAPSPRIDDHPECTVTDIALGKCPGTPEYIPPGGAIKDIPLPPLPPAPGTTSKCPRGQAYDKPWFGFGGCDPGYVSSSGALVQGMGAQCICAETPEGRQVTQTPAEGEYQPDDLGLGGLMKMLPQLIMVLVVVQIIGAFRK